MTNLPLAVEVHHPPLRSRPARGLLANAREQFASALRAPGLTVDTGIDRHETADTEEPTMTATVETLHPTPDQGGEQTFHHGARSEFNAWFFRAFDRYINHISRHHKREAFTGVRAGDVVELGAGVGANFAHLPHGARILAVEPSRAMHEQLAARAAERGLDLTVLGAYAEDLPLPDASVDEVICSLVLCTVQDQAATLAEIRRVLRPGGSFRFVEHVAAPWWSPRRWLQHVIRRPWSWLFEGCDLCRHTVAVIEEAGFREMQARRARFRRSLFVPVNSAVYGYGIR